MAADVEREIRLRQRRLQHHAINSLRAHPVAQILRRRLIYITAAPPGMQQIAA
jgi:hypothetical protein